MGVPYCEPAARHPEGRLRSLVRADFPRRLQNARRNRKTLLPRANDGSCLHNHSGSRRGQTQEAAPTAQRKKAPNGLFGWRAPFGRRRRRCCCQRRERRALFPSSFRPTRSFTMPARAAAARKARSGARRIERGAAGGGTTKATIFAQQTTNAPHQTPRGNEEQ